MSNGQESLDQVSPAAATVRANEAVVTADFWSLLREAVAGSRRDYTREPIGRAVILLAIPMVLEMVMESVFAVADIFWVSKLGPNAVAIGLSMGATAVVARRIGEGHREAGARAAVQVIGIGIALAAIIGITGAS